MIVAILLFFLNGELQGAQVIGLAENMDHCAKGLATVMHDTASQLPKGVKAVPYCLDASPKIRPTGTQTQL